MRVLRLPLFACLVVFLTAIGIVVEPAGSRAATKPHIFQHPALSKDLIAFGYAGDLWTVPRAGGVATRLTVGVGIETEPIFSPDGNTIAFTGDYDGNTDVFTIPATGGVPFRVTYHPAADFAVAWTPDGRNIVFRSTRISQSRYTQLYSVPAKGGIAKPLPLPMAYQGQFSPDGKEIAYSPCLLRTASITCRTWRGAIITAGVQARSGSRLCRGLSRSRFRMRCRRIFRRCMREGRSTFLSSRKGKATIYKYDPATKSVTQALANDGPDIRSLHGEGDTLVYDRLGEIYLYDTKAGTSKLVPIEIDADLPEVRSRIDSVGDELENASISPTGVRAVIEAHGDIFTVAAKHGPTRDITNTPGVMEREPAWSPDGQSIAYFSDESGLYALHVAPQTGSAVAGAAAVKKFALAPEPAYYFDPKWSPDSKKIAFYDNRLNTYMLDTTTGKLTVVNDKNVYGGFSSSTFEFAWSPDSKWIAYPRSMANHLHAIFLVLGGVGAVDAGDERDGRFA